MYPGPCQASEMKLLAKIFIDLKLLTIAKGFPAIFILLPEAYLRPCQASKI